MTLDKDQIVSKIWNLCSVLRDDGVSYSDYLEQITYLIFLKMAHERTKAPYNQPSIIPAQRAREGLVDKDGDKLEEQYRHSLENLAKTTGILGMIFRKSQNKISNPAMLKRVVNEIDKIEWNILGVDVKGEIYEGLLSKVAEDTKSGAGQYFTPRVLINTMIEVLKPNVETTIHDPCAGTWGFLLSAHDYILHHGNLDKDQQKILKTKLLSWAELVQSTARLAVMNMFLHGIWENESPITVCDSLLSDPGKRYKMVATNPPFGKKSSVAFTNEAGNEEKDDTEILREDFRTITKNKQLNFLQHIHTILEIWGKAAVVLPDNVLFEWWSGEVVRKKLLQQCNLHTILRLPTGIFYANGVKANVIFFEKRWASEQIQTKDIWFYDLRTNMKFSLKQNQMKKEHLKEFIECYNPDNINKRTEMRSETNPEWRWRKYSYDEVIKRDKTSLDIFWLKDQSLEDSENLPEPGVIALQIVDDLENALEQFNLIQKDLEK